MEITGVVKNWRHFAIELNVAPEVIESLKWYVTFSPTTTVFDNLEFTKPDLTIGTLKEVFTNMGRNDLKRLLDRGIVSKLYSFFIRKHISNTSNSTDFSHDFRHLHYFSDGYP